MWNKLMKAGVREPGIAGWLGSVPRKPRTLPRNLQPPSHNENPLIIPRHYSRHSAGASRYPLSPDLQSRCVQCMWSVSYLAWMSANSTRSVQSLVGFGRLALWAYQNCTFINSNLSQLARLAYAGTFTSRKKSPGITCFRNIYALKFLQHSKTSIIHCKPQTGYCPRTK